MKFVRYQSIENVHRNKFLAKIDLEGYSDPSVVYIVQEKVHGANFSFWFDGVEHKQAKRSGFTGTDFYGCLGVIEETRPFVELAWKHLNLQEGDVLHICGELYGGVYDHQDVPKQPVKAVQKGICYRPDQSFYAFDVRINDTLMNLDKAVEMLEACGFDHARTMFKGTFKECIDFSNEFQTTIPKLLGLPEIENNVCEGIVIKPVEPLFLSNGDRIIIKSKNSKWDEKKGKKRSFLPSEIALSDNLREAIEAASTYICENRLRNALSKVEVVSDKMFGQLLRLFFDDLLEEFREDSEQFENLEKSEKTLFAKLVMTDASTFIRQHFIAILDETF